MSRLYIYIYIYTHYIYIYTHTIYIYTHTIYIYIHTHYIYTYYVYKLYIYLHILCQSLILFIGMFMVLGRLMLKCDGTWRTGGGKWRGNWRMQWVASTLHTTSEHGVSSITTADAHTSAASSRLNWRPRRFKWTRLFRRKTKSGFCACAITFQTQSIAASLCVVVEMPGLRSSLQSIDEIRNAWSYSSFLRYVLKLRLVKPNHTCIKLPTPDRNRSA